MPQNCGLNHLPPKKCAMVAHFYAMGAHFF
nr:MAG TPA: hypothetical protein [Caudoviricetes sp.]